VRDELAVQARAEELGNLFEHARIRMRGARGNCVCCGNFHNPICKQKNGGKHLGDFAFCRAYNSLCLFSYNLEKGPLWSPPLFGTD
jgi:hypothetical protein